MIWNQRRCKEWKGKGIFLGAKWNFWLSRWLTFFLLNPIGKDTVNIFSLKWHDNDEKDLMCYIFCRNIARVSNEFVDFNLGVFPLKGFQTRHFTFVWNNPPSHRRKRFTRNVWVQKQSRWRIWSSMHYLVKEPTIS